MVCLIVRPNIFDASTSCSFSLTHSFNVKQEKNIAKFYFLRSDVTIPANWHPFQRIILFMEGQRGRAVSLLQPGIAGL